MMGNKVLKCIVYKYGNAISLVVAAAIFLKQRVAQSAGAVEYTDCFSTEE